MAPSGSKLRVRRIRKRDAGRAAELSSQLGYPASEKEMKKRLAEVLRDKEAACFVAEIPGEGVIGWIHISVTPLLEVERRAEVNGLVVDESMRSQGAGAKLLEAGEKWARGRQCKGMSVRSNVLRERAHGFYLKQGYQHYKTQKAFRKSL
ncbi:MAG TPA: GNAT family N-acetyltransferase [Candidatus Eisenbacteria bacterium]|nr:GNAT family N-acetyltransferase [Candidatus Eisenbacteria bacterium]